MSVPARVHPTPAAGVAAPARAGRLLGITPSAFDPASRVRLVQWIPYLERAGWRVDHRPNRPDRQWRSPLRNRLARGLHYRAGRVLMKANRLADVRAAGDYDVVFVNRDLAGGGLFFERRLLRRNPRVVFDFDDAIFIGRNEAAVRWMCANAAWVTPGNAYLADFARQVTDRVTVIPTVIDTDRYEPRRVGVQSGPVRVGWSGSDLSIGTTLFPHLELLRRAQTELDFELVVITNTRPTLPVEGLRWSFRPWREDEEGRIGEFFDVGIMPLEDTPFQRGKCGLKLLQYMAAGLPTIGSPVGVNAEIVQPGRTGYLATTAEEWIEALRALCNSPERRAELGRNGRERCEAHYSIRRWLPVLLDILDRVARADR